MKFLSRLVEFKILVNWGLVHSVLTLSDTTTSVKNISRTTSFRANAFRCP
jgi:hypothetical protein